VMARLVDRGFDPAVAQQAVDGLDGLIDDHAVARGAALAATRAAPVSNRVLKDLVRRTGADAPAVQIAVREAIDGRSDAELARAAAEALAKRTPARLAPAARLRRLTGALQRRGFDADLALEAASKALGVSPPGDLDHARTDYDD
jgi:SOS response regulatory protein OraA/RecX